MPKSRSIIFGLCEEYYTKSLEHDAIESTYANRVEQNSDWNDYSYHTHDPFLRIAKLYKKKIEAAKPVDYYDELAKKIILIDIN